jgi:lipooligosaccharide transport system permease protein
VTAASTPAAVRVWESHLAVYRRIWRSNVIGAFITPLLYLLGMGLGVGGLVDGSGRSDLLDGLSYLAFLAPALLATTSMMSASQDSMWPVMDGFMWSYAYRAMASTPLGARDIVAGVALWHATRAAIGVTGVAAVLVLFDDTRSAGLLLAIPFAVLTGLAFAMPITAWSSTRTREQSFPAIQRFIIVPLFLFGGAFYPVGQLPGWLQPVARVTPLWHGVELCRGAVVGRLGVAAACVHVAVLLAFTLAGWLVCVRTYERRLAE